MTTYHIALHPDDLDAAALFIQKLAPRIATDSGFAPKSQRAQGMCEMTFDVSSDPRLFRGQGAVYKDDFEAPSSPEEGAFLKRLAEALSSALRSVREEQERRKDEDEG